MPVCVQCRETTKAGQEHDKKENNEFVIFLFVRNLFNVDGSLISTGVAVEDNAKTDKARKFGKKIDDQQESV